MRTTSFILILAFLLSACAVPQPTPTPLPTLEPVSLSGEWLGGFVQSDGTVLSLRFKFTDTGGTLNIQPYSKEWNLTDFVHADPKITFSSVGTSFDPFEQIHFEGELSDNRVTGELNWDGKTYQTTFTSLTEVDSASLQKYVGVYRFESGRAVSVLLSPSYDLGGLEFFPPGLMFTDFTTGDLRGLYPLEDLHFWYRFGACPSLSIGGIPDQIYTR